MSIRLWRLLAHALVVAVLGSTVLLQGPTGTARADGPVPPAGGSFTLEGSGFGHGWGMSQWGAYGAAKKGLDWRRIVGFYYPGTTVTKQRASTIRVWLSADTDAALTVRAASGLKLAQADGKKSVTLPTGSSYAEWRVRRSGKAFVLEHRSRSGSWKSRSSGLSAAGPWVFSSSAKVVAVVLPSGSVTEYRGLVGLVAHQSSARTVNTVDLEEYLRGVVPAEMPTSWAAEAVRAQSVAARSYAVRLRSAASTGGYDTCDTTSCQVYKGLATTSGSRRTVHETSGGDQAIKATAGQVLTYQGKPALTQFSASNGGHSAQGDFPYLKAVKDPYDGVAGDQSWTKKLSTTDLARQWPKVGTVRELQVTKRDGRGRWGGRVLELKVIGSKGSQTVSGTTFRSRFGLRSTLFTAGEAIPQTPWASFPRSLSREHRVTLTSLDAKGRLLAHPVTGRSSVGAPITLLSATSGYAELAAVGDWDGDGVQDVVGLAKDGRLDLLRGKVSGGLQSRLTLAKAKPRRSITGPGDLSGDGRPDLLVIERSGEGWLLVGDGRTGVASTKKLRDNWSRHDELHGVGDVDGDGWPDVVIRQGDRIWLCRGSAKGLGAGIGLGSGWGTLQLHGAGDVTGDGRVDLVTRSRWGTWQVRPGKAAGQGLGFGSPVTMSGSGLGVRPTA